MAEGLHPLRPGAGEKLRRQALQKGFRPASQRQQPQTLLLPCQQGGAVGRAGLVLNPQGHTIESQPTGQGLRKRGHPQRRAPFDAAGDGTAAGLDRLREGAALCRGCDQQPLLLRLPKMGGALPKSEQQVGDQPQCQHRQQKLPAHRGLQLLAPQQGAQGRQAHQEHRRRQAVAQLAGQIELMAGQCCVGAQQVMDQQPTEDQPQGAGAQQGPLAELPAIHSAPAEGQQ